MDSTKSSSNFNKNLTSNSQHQSEAFEKLLQIFKLPDVTRKTYH